MSTSLGEGYGFISGGKGKVEVFISFVAFVIGKDKGGGKGKGEGWG